MTSEARRPLRVRRLILADDIDEQTIQSVAQERSWSLSKVEEINDDDQDGNYRQLHW